MNINRLILAIVAGYVVVFLTDLLIHEKWMVADYAATQQIWRAQPERASMLGWMLGAQLLTVISFVLLWTRWANTARLGCAIGFGFLMGARSRGSGQLSSTGFFRCRGQSRRNGSSR